MKAFLASCAVAVIIAVGAFYVLGIYQVPADAAYSVPNSVRL